MRMMNVVQQLAQGAEMLVMRPRSDRYEKMPKIYSIDAKPLTELALGPGQQVGGQSVGRTRFGPWR